MKYQQRRTYWKSSIFVFALAAVACATVFQNALASPQITSGNTLTASISHKAFADSLASSLNIKKAAPSKCFKDLSLKDPSTPSICALKSKKVFSGAQSSKFFPEKATTWNFAIISLCKAEKWKVSKTYTKCLAYARTNFGALLPASINSKKSITTVELAALLGAKSSAALEAPVNVSHTPPPAQDSSPLHLPPPAPQSVAPFTPVEERNIATDTFENISLSSPLPNRFSLNETYFIEGDLINASASEVFVFLCPEGQGCDNSINFIEKTSGTHFRVPVYFRQAGNFEIGIIPGRGGQSRIENISVLAVPPSEPAGGQAATSLLAAYAEGKTAFSWNGQGSLTHVIIFQNSARKDYYFRQGIHSFTPKSEDFANFQAGKAAWLVKQDSAQSDEKQITLAAQELRKITAEDIQVQNLTEVFSSPTRFTFTGKALTRLSKKAYFIVPDGSVREVDFASDDVNTGQQISVNTDLNASGTYIFEINNLQGNAVLNIPLYVGNVVPMLPDFFVLHADKLDTAPITNVQKMRTDLLALINADRAKYGFAAVALADDLNSIAQAHSADMVNRNFFAHVNPSGIGPDDRRKNANIPTPIRENLGKAATLASAEAGLMRSPVHRSAILDPAMKRVGLGVAKSADGYFLVTENFAGNPISESDLPSIAEKLLNDANDKRAGSGLASLAQDASVQDVANVWAHRMANEGFFDVADPQGNTLLSYARGRGINSALQIYIVQTSEVSQLKDEILSEDGVSNGGNKKVGIGLGISKIGDFSMTVIYTP